MSPPSPGSASSLRRVHLDDFTISQGERTVTCPAGHTRPMRKSRTVTFGALCAGCPLRSKCTTAKDGRSMTIHPHEGLLREARAQARTKTFKQAYPTRSAIERIISWTATQNGRRVRLRYIGTSKTTPGCTTGAPRSTSAPCSTPGWPAATGPGCWPNQPGSPHGPAAGALRARPRPFPRAPWPISGLNSFLLKVYKYRQARPIITRDGLYRAPAFLPGSARSVPVPARNAQRIWRHT